MGVTSEQDCRNMNRFVVACAYLACAMGAPTVPLATTGYAGQIVSAPVASAPAVVGQTHHSYASGPPVVQNRVEYGVVGQRTVQTGVASVVAGHQYAVAGQETIPQPPPMLPELPRTSLRPEPSLLQPSQLPQHHMPPSHQLQETSDLPQLILSPRPESLPQSDPTPESPPR